MATAHRKRTATNAVGQRNRGRERRTRGRAGRRSKPPPPPCAPQAARLERDGRGAAHDHRGAGGGCGGGGTCTYPKVSRLPRDHTPAAAATRKQKRKKKCRATPPASKERRAPADGGAPRRWGWRSCRRRRCVQHSPCHTRLTGAQTPVAQRCCRRHESWRMGDRRPPANGKDWLAGTGRGQTGGPHASSTGLGWPTGGCPCQQGARASHPCQVGVKVEEQNEVPSPR